METSEIIEILRKKDYEKIEEYLQLKGRKATIEKLAEYLDKRAYFTICASGEIKKKEINYAIPAAAFVEDEKFLAETLTELADPKERTKIDKIERYSNVQIEELKEKFFKLLANGNVDFAKRYGKELFLKDSTEFYRMLFHYSLMDSSSQKALMALAMKKLTGSEYNEEILYLVISYFTKVKPDFYDYENADAKSTDKNEIKELILKNRENIHTKEFLNLYSCILVLNEYDYPREEILTGMILKKLERFEETSEKKPLTEIERRIVDSLIP